MPGISLGTSRSLSGRSPKGWGHWGSSLNDFGPSAVTDGCALDNDREPFYRGMPLYGCVLEQGGRRCYAPPSRVCLHTVHITFWKCALIITLLGTRKPQHRHRNRLTVQPTASPPGSDPVYGPFGHLLRGHTHLHKCTHVKRENSLCRA